MMNIKLIFVALATLVLTGCATIFGETKQNVQFTADKPTTIVINDKLGQARHTIPKNITIRKSANNISYFIDGCNNSLNSNVDREITGVWWLNILNGYFGMGVDYFTGAMWRYDSLVKVNTVGC